MGKGDGAGGVSCVRRGDGMDMVDDAMSERFDDLLVKYPWLCYGLAFGVCWPPTLAFLLWVVGAI